jgi:hypothetical protein
VELVGWEMEKTRMEIEMEKGSGEGGIGVVAAINPQDPWIGSGS